MEASMNMVLISSLLLLFWSLKTSAYHHEYHLYSQLMQQYNPLVRPVQNSSSPIVIRMGLILQQIMGVDEKNQIIEVNAWTKYSWNDFKLSWDPNDYGGVTDIRFPVGLIWRPDVLVYNSVDSQFDSMYPSNHVVQSNGDVLWIPPGILRVSCKIDIRWFPFDEQSCHIKFGSWTYHGYALDLQPEDPKGADLSEYIENGEWFLTSTPVKRNVVHYECCVEPYYDVKFYLNIRRRTLYYGFNLIIPSLLISLMTILGFILPPDAGEKITLEITVLLSLCFFSSTVAEMTPTTSEAVPVIGIYFTCCMVVVSASVVFTVLVLNLNNRSHKTHIQKMGKITKNVLLNWLPWLLRIRRPGYDITPPHPHAALKKLSRSKSSKQESKSLVMNTHRVEILDNGVGTSQLNPFQQASVLPTNDHHSPSPLTENQRNHENLESTVDRILERDRDKIDPGIHVLIMMLQIIDAQLQFMVERMEQEGNDEDADADWKFAALVIDRLCLIVFTAFIIASTCGILFSAPLFTFS